MLGSVGICIFQITHILRAAHSVVCAEDLAKQFNFFLTFCRPCRLLHQISRLFLHHRTVIDLWTLASRSRRFLLDAFGATSVLALLAAVIARMLTGPIS